jgi:hypothetical protein
MDANTASPVSNNGTNSTNGSPATVAGGNNGNFTDNSNNNNNSPTFNGKQDAFSDPGASSPRDSNFDKASCSSPEAAHDDFDDPGAAEFEMRDDDDLDCEFD